MAIKIERDNYSTDRDAHVVVEYRGGGRNGTVRMWVVYRGDKAACQRWAQSYVNDKLTFEREGRNG